MMYEIQKAGHQCVQVTSEIVIRQVTAQYPDNLIIIGHDIPQSRAQGIRHHYPTIALTADATAKDVLIEIGMIMKKQKPAN